MCPSSNQSIFRAFYCLSFVLLSLQVHAQNSTKETSPYSRYGLGDDISGLNVAQRGMGYLGVTAAEPYSINTENPASYAWLRLTTFELGGEARTRSYKTIAGNYQSGTATFSYLNLGIPFAKRFALNFGLRPAQRTFYRFLDTVNLNQVGPAQISYDGEGDLNEVVLGAAVKIKNFSLGGNASYQFGDYGYYNRLMPLVDTNVLSSEYSRNYKLNGWRFTLGGIYEPKLNEKLSLRLGATADLGHDLNGTKSETWIGYQSGNKGGTVDTAYALNNVEGQVAMPLKLGVGVQLIGAKGWNVGINIQQTNWDKFRNYGLTDSLANQTLRLGIGGAYTPNPNNIYKYFNRVTYRLGFYYGTDKVQLMQQQLNYFGVTAGFSLPFRRFTDRIHTSFEYGQRGTLTNGLIKENFFRFGVGFSLNDRWFVKPKYE